MVLLTVSLAVLLAELFPLQLIVYGAFGVFLGTSLLPGPQITLKVLLNYGPALLTSWWLLRRLTVPSVAKHLTRGRRWMKLGVALYVVYLFLAASGFLLSAIPYGGGAVPRVLSLLPVAVKALLFLGLAQALLLELPVVKFGDRRTEAFSATRPQ